MQDFRDVATDYPMPDQPLSPIALRYYEESKDHVREDPWPTVFALIRDRLSAMGKGGGKYSGGAKGSAAFRGRSMYRSSHYEGYDGYDGYAKGSHGQGYAKGSSSQNSEGYAKGYAKGYNFRGGYERWGEDHARYVGSGKGGSGKAAATPQEAGNLWANYRPRSQPPPRQPKAEPQQQPQQQQPLQQQPKPEEQQQQPQQQPKPEEQQQQPQQQSEPEEELEEELPKPPTSEDQQQPAPDDPAMPSTKAAFKHPPAHLMRRPASPGPARTAVFKQPPPDLPAGLRNDPLPPPPPRKGNKIARP